MELRFINGKKVKDYLYHQYINLSMDFNILWYNLNRWRVILMLGKKVIKDKVDYQNANEVLALSSKILQIAYILIFILGIYAITLIAKEWNLLGIIFNFLKMLSPLFIGIVFAWLLDPAVDFLSKKGIKRSFGTFIIVLIFISTMALILAVFIPLMKDQIDQFVAMVPNLIKTLTDWATGFVAGLGQNNAAAVQDSITLSLKEIGDELSANLPNATINFVTSFFSGMGTFLIGLIVGFYLLLNFDQTNTKIVEFLPERHRKSYDNIATEMNTSLRNFVSGTLFTSFLIFVSCTIGFAIVGLKSPILFGLICGITNLIPYIGPYIGGIPAVIVGFIINPLVGVLTFVIIMISQFLESFIIRPVIMSKAVKLHPVTIIVGLIVFGNYFGILGMILSTPIIAIFKIIFGYIVKKYNLFSWNELKQQN